MRKWRVFERIYGTKYSWKGNKDRSRHKDRIKRSGQAGLSTRDTYRIVKSRLFRQSAQRHTTPQNTHRPFTKMSTPFLHRLGPSLTTNAWLSSISIVQGRLADGWFSSVQFSPMTNWGGVGGGHEGRFSRDPVLVFSAGGPCEQFWHGAGIFILWNFI